jgi:CRP-like cAMP-binding protein
MSYVDILSNLEIFSDLNQKQLAKIVGVCKEKEYSKNEVIFLENSPSKEFYIIVLGKVDIQLDPDLIRGGKKEHKSHTIVTLKKGQSFGEVALVDQGLRSASAVVASDKCKVLVISREDFMNLLQEDIQMGFYVMQNLAADLCFKIRNTNLMVREALLV